MSNVQFNLSLAVEADQTIAGLLSGADLAALAADSAMEISVTADDLSGVFKFQTDSTDLTDASADDIQYACDSGEWPDLTFGESSVTGDKVGSVASAVVKEDMLRHVAKNIFGTHFGVDLLSNEEAIQTDINNLDADLKTAIEGALDATGGTTLSPKTRADSTNNYAKEVLDQLINQIVSNDNDDARIRSTEMLANANGGFHNFVFKSGDSLTFKVTYNPEEGDANPHAQVSTATMESRSYLVTLNVA
jgi:hypothetical protein